MNTHEYNQHLLKAISQRSTGGQLNGCVICDAFVTLTAREHFLTVTA